MRHIRTKRNSKDKNQRYHSKIRALQHFGQQITNADLEKMAEIYRHSEDTRILKKQTCRLVKAVITYNDTVYPIVYDKKRHQLVTILKPEYLNTEERNIYDACRARMLCKKNIIEHHVPEPIRDIKLNIDIENDTIETEVVEHEETTSPVEENDHVVLPTEDEGKTVMEEIMKRLNF